MNDETQNKDLLLTARAAAGDASAQEEIFLEFNKFVVRVCERIVKNPDIAEDLAQIAFLNVFRKIKSFTGAAKLKTWIYRIAVNQSLMYLRNEKRRPATGSLTDTEDYLAPSYSSRLDDRILINAAIAQLPKGYKNVFILREIFGFEHAECGRILGIAEGTSKSQTFKANERMRKLIRRRTNPTVAAGA